MNKTKIEWCDATFNPWRGCAKVSPGCANCYAESLAKRFSHLGEWGANGRRVVASDAQWQEPWRWCRKAEAEGVRRLVFCASLADVFEDYKGGRVTDHKGNHLAADLTECRRRLFQLIDDTRTGLDWLLLTKRPENIAPMMAQMSGGSFAEDWTFADSMPNVWLGTSAEDQRRWDERVPKLLKIPAAVHFGVSFFFKQWGEFDAAGRRVGKKAAGRELLGKTFSEFPPIPKV